MMHLRLSPTLHTEPFRPSVVRLLFEGKVPSDRGEDLAGKDFYLYVWVKDYREVIGFQAVLNEEIILVYRAPDYLTFGRISRFPMNRAVDTNEVRYDRDLLLAAMARIENPQFPLLISQIEKTAVAGQRATIELEPAESSYCATLPV
jgi:hypothetical protein